MLKLLFSKRNIYENVTGKFWLLHTFNHLSKSKILCKVSSLFEEAYDYLNQGRTDYCYSQKTREPVSYKMEDKPVSLSNGKG